MGSVRQKLAACFCALFFLVTVIYSVPVSAREETEPYAVIRQLVSVEEITTESIQEQQEYIVETPYDTDVFVENGIEFHYVAGDTWQGLMAVIKDPSRVFVGMPADAYTGAPGADATRIASRYGAVFAVNGAFFKDTNQVGNGGTPIGFVFSEGRQTYGGSSQARTLMGWDSNNQFVCEVMTGAQAMERGIRDAVTCDPVLVQNGEIGNLSTRSTTLMDARSAIGAREDGCVLILVADGRMSHSIGATTRDLAECMLSFGAVNAGNMDGGGSVSLYYGGSPFEGIASIYGCRAVPNAICVRGE